MKKLIILISLVIAALSLSLASCEAECEDCENHYYFDEDELEEDACEALHDCTIGDIVEISASECDDNNYPSDCWIALIESNTCYEMKTAFKNECYGEENSSSNNTTTNNSNNTDDYDALCEIIRIDCGYDNMTESDCLNSTMSALGSSGRSCIENAGNCVEVDDCLDEYVY